MGREEEKFDVYVANALFSDADQAFNSMLASKLRDQDLQVFLPQETAHNESKAPTGEDIFISDTKAVLRSRILLAVLDGEVIDSGVACEIGIAFAAGIPVIGLWTDIRRRRKGEGRIYHNIFVTGAIERNGLICSSVDDAIRECTNLVQRLSPSSHDERVLAHYVGQRDGISKALPWLPSAYKPAFDPGQEIVRQIMQVDTPPKYILDFGAGEGRLAGYLKSQWKGIEYLAVDPAFKGPQGNAVDLSSVPDGAMDCVILSFILHDVSNREVLMHALSKKLRPNGHLILLDLTTDDLPALTSALASRLWTAPRSLDLRLSTGELIGWADQLGLEIMDLSEIVRSFLFHSKQQLFDYCDYFGLLKGFDLPWLPLAPFENALRETFDTLCYPFTDKRCFVSCRLMKRSKFPSSPSRA